jgi:chromosome segregation ATPase
MPPIFDFTSALPWLAAGFLAGLLVFWLIRAMLGIDRRRVQEIAAANSELDEARRAHAALSQNYANVEGDRVRLGNEVAQLSQRVQLIPQYERQIADLRQSEAARASAADAAAAQLASFRDTSSAEMATLRQDAETAVSTAKYYEAEFSKLLEAHQALSREASAGSDMVTKLKSDYEAAAREAGEATRLRSEIASAKAQIESLQADMQEGKAAVDRYQTEIARLRRDHEQALVAIETAKSSWSSSSDEINRLKSELAAAQKRGESADEVLRLNAEIARLKPLENERADLYAEITRLKGALDAAGSQDNTADYQRMQDEMANLRFAAAESEGLASEVTRLRAELSAAPKQQDSQATVQRLSDEIARLKAQASAEANSYADEIERIKSESAKLNSALVSARADERNAAMELHTAKNDLQQARTAMEETSRMLAERHAEIEQLKARLANAPADVENYRRFKEALDAANRIAAGLPAKE